MPDLWDTPPDNVVSTPHEQPDPPPSDHDDHSQQVRLKDDRGRLQSTTLPATMVLTRAAQQARPTTHARSLA
jgi:hypothetical protein